MLSWVIGRDTLTHQTTKWLPLTLTPRWRLQAKSDYALRSMTLGATPLALCHGPSVGNDASNVKSFVGHVCKLLKLSTMLCHCEPNGSYYLIPTILQAPLFSLAPTSKLWSLTVCKYGRPGRFGHVGVMLDGALSCNVHLRDGGQSVCNAAINTVHCLTGRHEMGLLQSGTTPPRVYTLSTSRHQMWPNHLGLPPCACDQRLRWKWPAWEPVMVYGILHCFPLGDPATRTQPHILKWVLPQ